MSIKIFVLKSGEKLISDAKELLDNEILKKPTVTGYLLKEPHLVMVHRERVYLTEEVENSDSGREIQVTFSPWIILSEDTEFVIPVDWVVTIADPLNSIKTMYEDKINGKNN